MSLDTQSTQMIGSIIIKLRPKGEIKVAGNGGENLYNLVLDMLAKKDSHTAEKVRHSKKEPLIKEINNSARQAIYYNCF